LNYGKTEAREAIEDKEDDPVIRDADLRVLRGASFTLRGAFLRAAFRYRVVPYTRFPYIGMRVARTFP